MPDEYLCEACNIPLTFLKSNTSDSGVCGDNVYQPIYKCDDCGQGYEVYKNDGTFGPQVNKLFKIDKETLEHKLNHLSFDEIWERDKNAY